MTKQQLREAIRKIIRQELAEDSNADRLRLVAFGDDAEDPTMSGRTASECVVFIIDLIICIMYMSRKCLYYFVKM